MENSNYVSCSASWKSNSSVNPIHSQWLHTTLSDLDGKVKAILLVIEEDSYPLADQPELFHRRREQISQVIEELCRSYRSLSEKYDQMSSDSSHEFNSENSTLSSDSNKTQQFTINKKTGDPRFIDFRFKSSNPNPESDVTNKEAVNLMSKKNCNMSFDTTLGLQDIDFTTFDREKTWHEMKFQVTKLMEENLQQQAELIKRNKEKREAIQELNFQLEHLKGENRALKSSLRNSNIDLKQNQSKKSSMVLSKNKKPKQAPRWKLCRI